MGNTMKAYALTGAKQWAVQELPIPAVTAPDEVLVKTKAVGVCGSDLEAWRGAHAHVQYPAVIGHEVVGEVVAVGEAVTDLKPGDRVAKESIEYCGKCYACRHGQPNVCRELKVWGFELDGGNREYFTSKADKLHRFSESIDWKYAAMIEPYTIAAQVNARANTQAGDIVLVHGLGPAGLAIADWAKRLGAVVVGSDMVPKRLELAKAFGIDHVVNAKEQDINKVVMELTGGEGANVIIEAAGVPVLLEQAPALISPAGRIVPITFNFNPTGISSGLINAKEASIIGSRLQVNKFPEMIRHLDEHLEHIKLLVTHVLPKEKIAEAFELAASRSPDVGKVVVSFEEENEVEKND